MTMKSILYILLVIMLLSCGTSSTYTAEETHAYEQLQSTIADQKFEILVRTVKPRVTSAFQQVANTTILGPGNSASNINVQSSGYFMRFKKDSVTTFLPFYGEQQFGGGYPGANHQGIEFNAIPEKFTLNQNEKKHSMELTFEIEDQFRGNERYNVYVNLFPNNGANIRISSTNRSSIEYSGIWKVLEEDKNE